MWRGLFSIDGFNANRLYRGNIADEDLILSKMFFNLISIILCERCFGQLEEFLRPIKKMWALILLDQCLKAINYMIWCTRLISVLSFVLFHIGKLFKCYVTQWTRPEDDFHRGLVISKMLPWVLSANYFWWQTLALTLYELYSALNVKWVLESRYCIQMHFRGDGI